MGRKVGIVERADPIAPAKPRAKPRKKAENGEKPKKRTTKKKSIEEKPEITEDKQVPQEKFRIDSEDEDGFSSLSENEGLRSDTFIL